MYTQAELLEKRSFNELLDLLFRLSADPDDDAFARRRQPLVLKALAALRERPEVPLSMLGWNAVRALANSIVWKSSTVSFRAERGNEHLAFGLWTLRLLGLAWRDRHCWHLLPEAQTLIIRGTRRQGELRLIDSLLDYCEQVLTLYGAAPVTVVARALQRLTGEHVSEADFDGYADFFFSLMIQRYGFQCTVSGDADTTETWLCSELCRDPEALVRQLRERDGQEWFCPSRHQICWLPGMIPVDEACGEAFTRALGEDMARRGETPDGPRLEDALVDAFLYVQEDDPQAAEDVLLGLFSPDQADAGRRLMVRQAVSTMPRWTDRGFSRQERIRRTAARIRPAGHDGPCPCGSGKKYKYCHGRLN